MKLAVVAIGGPHGSGKSSIAKKIANEFNMTYLSAGEVFRKLAKEKIILLKNSLIMLLLIQK